MKALDRLLERVSLDEPHRVVRTPAGIRAQAVDGDNAWVFEPAGDLGLGDEPLTAQGVVGVPLEDLLQGHLAVQLAVERHENHPQPAPCMRPQDAESLAIGGGRADGITAGAVGVFIVVVGRPVRRANAPERRLDVRAAGVRQTFPSRASDGQHGEALLNVAAKGLKVHIGDGLDGDAPRGIEMSESHKMIGQGSRPVARPRREGRDQRPWSIRPFWRASRPKSRSREGSAGWGMIVARHESRRE